MKPKTRLMVLGAFSFVEDLMQCHECNYIFQENDPFTYLKAADEPGALEAWCMECIAELNLWSDGMHVNLYKGD